MNDINKMVQKASNKLAMNNLKQSIFNVFNDFDFLSDDELCAYANDMVRSSSGVEMQDLIIVWFMEWKASKESK